MNRYEPATVDMEKLLSNIRATYFPSLWEARVLLLFDTKKNTRGGKVVLAKIQKTNDLVRLLTQDESEPFNGYDFIITVDKKCWESTGEEDHIRILRHELRHVFYDIESDSDPFKIIGHDFEDFQEEVRINAEDPNWAIRCATLTSDLYEQEKELAKEGKKTPNLPSVGERVNVRRNVRISK